MKTLLTFLGWFLAAFFLLPGLLGLSAGLWFLGAVLIFWGVALLPPVWKQTQRYGLTANILGRIAIVVVGAVTIQVSTYSQPLPTPIPESAPVIAGFRSFTVAPLVKPSPKPKPSPRPSPKPSPKPTPSPSVNPDAAVRSPKSGSCDCPYDTDSKGRRCGKRSAYLRPGGRDPVCYQRDKL